MTRSPSPLFALIFGFFLLLAAACGPQETVVVCECPANEHNHGDSDTDGDTDNDGDTDHDGDGDTDHDGDTDNDGDGDTEWPPACEDIHLKDQTDFPVGVSFGNEQLMDETMHIVAEFDQITSTQFFTTLIWTGPETFYFDAAELAVALAEDNNQQVHGHALLYPLSSVIPDHLEHFQGSNEAFEERVENFITTTLSHFQGQVRGYDVTNELFEYNNSTVEQNWMRQRYGSDEEYFDFIARLFHWAHAADPEALLFYNDYGQEFTNNNHEKGRAIADQLQAWLDAGVPIHGYGLQMHVDIYRPIEDIEAALELAVSTGLQVHISELDISVNHAGWDISGVSGGEQGIEEMTAELHAAQREMYRLVADAYRRIVPADQRYGITLWDLSDEFSWLNWTRFEAGTLFDFDHQRKPAFYGFAEGLSGNDYSHCP